MYTRDAKKLAHELGLKDGPDVGYGVIHGIAVTFSDTLNGRLLNLYVGTPEGAWPDVKEALSKPPAKYGIRSIQAEPKGGMIEVLFNTTIGVNKRFKSFLETEVPMLTGLGFPGVSRCAFCGEPLSAAETKWALAKPDNVALPLHDGCYYDYERKIGDEAYARAAEPNRKVLPAIGALLGGLIGSIPWVILYMLGYFASLAGVVIGLGANYGHKLFGGKPGKTRVFLVILMIAIMVPVALAVSEVASFAWSILDGSLATSSGYAADAFTLDDLFPLLHSIWEYPEARAEMIPILVKNLALGYLFAALGGVWAYSGFLRRENRTSRAKLVRL